MSEDKRPYETVIHPKPLSGAERIGDTGATVLDFWRWADSDLVSNTARGVLAEFLVAKALGDTAEVRDSWALYDVTMPASGTDGPIRVEVKSGGYLQTWKQRQYSKIVFTRFKSWAWSPDTGKMDMPPDYRADVYVFAVHTCTDPVTLDVIDPSQWEFRVLPRATLAKLGVNSLGWERVRKLAEQALMWSELAEAVRRAHACNSGS